MDTATVDQIIDGYIEQYDQALGGIRQCISAYENNCSEIIKIISKASSLPEVNEQFDELQNIQSKLSFVFFARKIDVGRKVETMIREFDRLDDLYIRKYWFDRFHSGVLWPE